MAHPSGRELFAAAGPELRRVGRGWSQAQASRTVEQILDRGWRPPGAATRGPFMKALELRCDFTRRKPRVRTVNSGDKRHQAVFGEAGRGLLEQVRVSKMLVNEPPDRASEPLRCPVEAALPQHASDVIPGVVWAHAANDRQPLVCGRLDAVTISGFLRCAHLRQGLWSPIAEPGVARKLPLGLGCSNARFCAFGDERALQLRHGAEDLKRKHALRRCRINGIAQRPKMSPLRSEILNHLEEVADRAGQTIEAHDDESVAGANFSE